MVASSRCGRQSGRRRIPEGGGANMRPSRTGPRPGQRNSMRRRSASRDMPQTARLRDLRREWPRRPRCSVDGEGRLKMREATSAPGGKGQLVPNRDSYIDLGGLCPHCDQQVETEHRRRAGQRERERASTRALPRNPVQARLATRPHPLQEHQHGGRGQFQRQDEGGPVTKPRATEHRSAGNRKPYLS